MEKAINSFKVAIEENARNLLRSESEVTKDKIKLRAYWRGIMHLLDLPQDDPTLRWGYGFINMLPEIPPIPDSLKDPAKILKRGIVDIGYDFKNEKI